MTPASSAAVGGEAAVVGVGEAVVGVGEAVAVVAAVWAAAVAAAWVAVRAPVAACRARPAEAVDLLPLVDPLRPRALAGATQAVRDLVVLVQAAAP